MGTFIFFWKLLLQEKPAWDILFCSHWILLQNTTIAQLNLGWETFFQKSTYTFCKNRDFKSG